MPLTNDVISVEWSQINFQRVHSFYQIAAEF